MEKFDKDDAFHTAVSKIAVEAEHSPPMGIVWNVPKNARHGHKWEGIAIIQQGEELLTRRFTVDFTPKSFVLKFLGKTRHFTSDYFG